MNRINRIIDEAKRKYQYLRCSFIYRYFGGEELSSRSFVNVDEVADELGVSKSHAYKVVQSLNVELREMGYMTISGRVSRQFFEERFFAKAQNQKTKEKRQ